MCVSDSARTIAVTAGYMFTPRARRADQASLNCLLQKQCSADNGYTPAYNNAQFCPLYTSDAVDDLLCVDSGGRRIIKKNLSSTSASSYNHLTVPLLSRL